MRLGIWFFERSRRLAVDMKFAFSDRLVVADGELLQTVRFRHEAREESAADAEELTGKRP